MRSELIVMAVSHLDRIYSILDAISRAIITSLNSFSLLSLLFIPAPSPTLVVDTLAAA